MGGTSTKSKNNWMMWVACVLDYSVSSIQYLAILRPILNWRRQPLCAELHTVSCTFKIAGTYDKLSAHVAILFYYHQGSTIGMQKYVVTPSLWACRMCSCFEVTLCDLENPQIAHCAFWRLNDHKLIYKVNQIKS